MIKIDNVQVFGFEGAIRGCRNPYESWSRSDSTHCEIMYPVCSECPVFKQYHSGNSFCVAHVFSNSDKFVIGKADMELCKKLIKAGSEHRKFLRFIHVQFDIRMPRFFATELDTYKIGTTKNSSSTMHLITKRSLTLDDFSYEEEGKEDMEKVIEMLNRLIEDYNIYSNRPDEEKKQRKKSGIFRRIKQLLPESFMQMATYDMTYETLLNIYHQRKNHRLSEWSGENGFCTFIINLPYMNEFLEDFT